MTNQENQENQESRESRESSSNNSNNIKAQETNKPISKSKPSLEEKSNIPKKKNQPVATKKIITYCGSLTVDSAKKLKESKDIFIKKFPQEFSLASRQENIIGYRHQVLIDTSGSIKKASEISKLLSQKGIKDHFIIVGQKRLNAGTISLGVFKEKSRASSRAKYIRGRLKNIPIKVIPLSKTLYHLEYRTIKDEENISALRGRLATAFSDSTLRLSLCKANN